MTEAEFWNSLEFRVCRELDGMPECQKRGLWCDGFIPRTYKVTKRKPHVVGMAWIGIGPCHQEEWELVGDGAAPCGARRSLIRVGPTDRKER